jgi:hypothetical protein
MLEGVEEGAGLMLRDAPRPESVPAELYRVRRRLSPKEVDLGFAGRYAREHKVHEWIAWLAAGDALEVRRRDGKWVLHDLAGNVVGRLASAFAPPGNMRCIGATVAAVVTRFEDDGRPEYRGAAAQPAVGVVIPELEFEPVEPVGPEDDPWAASAVAIDGNGTSPIVSLSVAARPTSHSCVTGAREWNMLDIPRLARDFEHENWRIMLKVPRIKRIFQHDAGPTPFPLRVLSRPSAFRRAGCVLS